jgi:hypothetical protein
MKKALIITIVILSCIKINAQTLTGAVHDKATKQPIEGVFVYLDGTSIIDVTTNSGNFTIPVKQQINTKLVLRHMSYQTVVIEEPFKYLPDTIYMEEQFNVLNEITVRADRFSRQQKLRAFREQFLGMTQAGRLCRIMNEGDIDIWFNMATNTLFASSDKPIEVVNTYLGYRVLVTLVDFWTKYSGVTLNPYRSQQTYYKITTMFKDLSSDNVRIKKRRDDVYEESPRNFFKSLAYDTIFYPNLAVSSDYEIIPIKGGVSVMPSANTLEPPIFIVYKDGFKIDPHSYFIIQDTLLQKMIHIPDFMLEKGNSDNFLLKFSVLHREKAGEMYYQQGNTISSGSSATILVDNGNKNYYSTISFFTDTLLVDKYGNIDKFDKVFFSGLMGRIRIGDLLPRDYAP